MQNKKVSKRRIAINPATTQKRFGEIPVETSSQVENLSIEDLESLGEDFLEFDSLEDLENWLMER